VICDHSADVDVRRASSPPIGLPDQHRAGTPGRRLVAVDRARSDVQGSTDVQRLPDGGEGIASNILADRLRKLEAANIIEKRRDPEDARRFLYRLSPKGIDLAPVLVELVIWSARHDADRRTTSSRAQHALGQGELPR
jgi:DNA-binding HxlR family transcriptional regulator